MLKERMTPAWDAPPPKLAVFNDMAGYGRCALTVEMPIISALRVQCCPIPTAILSNHAGYPSCFLDDYTDRMEPYMEAWERLEFAVDGILTGFLGSARQAELAAGFIRRFGNGETKVFVDPAMGDNGHVYRICDESLCEAMRRLLPLADVVTPNLTEACLLTGTPYKETGWNRKSLRALTEKLLQMGAGAVVLTGVARGGRMVNVVHETGAEPAYVGSRRVGGHYHGTGDAFCAVLSASLMRGVSLRAAVRRAADFTRLCVERTQALGTAEQDGLCLEDCLGWLVRRSNSSAHREACYSEQ